PPECARIQRPRRWRSRTDPAPDGAHERHCPCRAEWWPYEFVLQQCIRVPDLRKTRSGGTRCAVSETAWSASGVQARMVSALGRTALNPGYTQADITLFRFDAAGAPAEHVRCRRYRGDGRQTLRKAIAVCETIARLSRHSW